MPAATFSEFSYGNAVVREAEALLTAMGHSLTAAPTLPSLIEENTVGYDAHLVTIDFALFLQFKRSFFVSRQHTSTPCVAAGGAPHCTWAHWGVPHYRFDVDVSSAQYHAMRGYEDDIALGYRAGMSSYAAPAFHSSPDFNAAYLSNQVLAQSVAVTPSTFDAVAAPGRHSYSFTRSLGQGAILSEPVPTEPRDLRAAITETAESNLPERLERHLTLAVLGAWASERASMFGLDARFDRGSAQSTLEFLSTFATIAGGTFVLVGRNDDEVPSP